MLRQLGFIKEQICGYFKNKHASSLGNIYYTILTKTTNYMTFVTGGVYVAVIFKHISVEHLWDLNSLPYKVYNPL